MTKRHFISFAKEIKDSAESVATRKAQARIVITVARQFNGRFDTDRFLAACGLDSKGDK